MDGTDVCVWQRSYLFMPMQLSVHARAAICSCPNGYIFVALRLRVFKAASTYSQACDHVLAGL